MKSLLQATLSFVFLMPAVAPVAANADVVFARPVMPVEANAATSSRPASPGTYSFVEVYRLSTESQRGLAKVGSGAPNMLEVDALGAPVGLAWSGSRGRPDAAAGFTHAPAPQAATTVIAETEDTRALDPLALLSGFAVVAFIVLRRAARWN